MSDNFHRWSPLADPIPVPEVRELPYFEGWCQWDIATKEASTLDIVRRAFPQAKPSNPSEWRLV